MFSKNTGRPDQSYFLEETVESFAECSNLKRVIIQKNVSFMGDGVFPGCSGELEIQVHENEYAETYCRAHGLRMTRI